MFETVQAIVRVGIDTGDSDDEGNTMLKEETVMRQEVEEGKWVQRVQDFKENLLGKRGACLNWG